MNKTVLTLALYLLVITGHCQDIFEKITDLEKREQAERKYALVQDRLAGKWYQKSKEPLDWLLENTPDLTKGLYINAVKIYTELTKSESDNQKRLTLQERVLELYDLRMKYFHDEINVRNRKCSSAYKYFTKNPTKYSYLLELFQSTFEQNGNKVGSNLLLAYMDVLRKNKKAAGLTLDDMTVMYQQLNKVMDYKASKGEELGEQREVITKMFIQANPEIDCNFIQEEFGANLMEDTTNISLAHTIIALSVEKKCSNEPIFLEAAKIFNTGENKEFGLTKIIAIKLANQGKFEESMIYFDQAIELADSPDQKASTYYTIANQYASKKNKVNARKYALEALKVDSDHSESYNLIGDLYFSSANDCKKEMSRVQDRAVYLLAYDMYEKAGNTKMMAAAKEQFPSMTYIHQVDLTLGSTLNVGCWINRTTTLRRLPK